eukprot:GFUD01012204.1.p1 GENE.GFUD01012204.1~~GFUD01012204.1.p1  ORF type:complete len:232 (+),score=72.87 GFUD01012204.1:45-740(+)
MEQNSLTTIEFLPEEIIRKIIFHLPSSDLKNAIAVCRQWRDVGSEAKLWRNFRLCINYKNVEMVEEMLNSQRLREMRSVKFLAWFVPVKTSESVIKGISEQNDVEELIVRGTHLTTIDPELLSSCLNRKRIVLLTKTRLVKEQVEVLFNNMNTETNLVELDIRDNDLSKVDPNVLANCINKLRKVTLMKTDLDRHQKRVILGQLRKKTSLKYLVIRQNELEHHNEDINFQN